MPYGITQCYLPPDRGDIPALTPAEAGTRLSDPGGMQGSVELGGLLQTEMEYPPEDGHHPSTNRARRALTSFMPNAANHCATPPTWVSCMQRLHSTQTKPSRLQVFVSCSVVASALYSSDCTAASWAPRRQISTLNSTHTHTQYTRLSFNNNASSQQASRVLR